MVFSPLHWIASTLAALIILSFAIPQNEGTTKPWAQQQYCLLSWVWLATYLQAASTFSGIRDIHKDAEAKKVLTLKT